MVVILNGRIGTHVLSLVMVVLKDETEHVQNLPTSSEVKTAQFLGLILN